MLSKNLCLQAHWTFAAHLHDNAKIYIGVMDTLIWRKGWENCRVYL